jgi:hypothetical protein
LLLQAPSASARASAGMVRWMGMAKSSSLGLTKLAYPSVAAGGVTPVTGCG